MKYNQIILFIYILTSFKNILSEIYPLKKIPAKVKALHRKRRSLDNNQDDSFLEKAYGNSYDLNYYYATLYLGPKKTPQTYILDTGSPTTTSPCSKCTSCGKHINKPYELDNASILKCNSNFCDSVQSNTCTDHQCAFSISYSEGSTIAGIFTMQEIYFEQINKNPNITNQSFLIPIGCTTKETHLFKTQLADGIMGLNNGDKSFVTLLYKNKIISKHLFSICLGQDDGYFSIGDIETSHHKTDIEYIPIINGEKNFYINIQQIKIGEKIIKNEYRGFIDSGTTISYFPNQIYNVLMDEFKSVCGKIGKKCGVFKDVSGLGYCGFFNSIEEKEKALNEYWPNITFYFEGHTYILTANDYNYDYNDNQIGACLGFEGEYASKITLGGTFMHGHDIIFDKGNQKIGFAVADCNGINNNNKEKYSNNNDININNDINNNNDINDNNNDDDKVIGHIDEKNNEKRTNKIEIIICLIVTVMIFLLLIVIIFIAIRKCILKKRERHHVQIDEISHSENNKKV